MRVNPNSDALSLTGVPSQPPSRKPRAEGDSVGFTGSKALDAALLQTPAARAEQVARAQQLVLDKSYPPMELIQKFSSLLALHMNSQDRSS
jgi:hypothetical protein